MPIVITRANALIDERSAYFARQVHCIAVVLILLRIRLERGRMRMAPAGVVVMRMTGVAGVADVDMRPGIVVGGLVAASMRMPSARADDAARQKHERDNRT
jgi:hypothetical protein